ncbi:MAG: GAF domain-containing protein, partial [Candidatus Hydrogenedentota bacterium]
MINEYTNPLISLHEINLQVLSKESPQEILEEILDQAVERTQADSGNISLLDEDRKHLEIHVFRGLDQDVPKNVRLKIGEGVTGRCILTGRSRNIGDTSQDPYYIAIRPDIKSELAVPLTVGGKAFGVITVDSAKPNAFSADHQEFMELLASYSAQIFANQLTLSNLKSRTKMLETLIEASQEMGKSPEVQVVFNKMIDILKKKLDLTRALIFL